MDLNSKVAIVTGAARGIGLATAKRLREAGARVVIWDLEPGAIDAVGDLAELTQRVDVSDGEAVLAAVREVQEKLGPIDILVNNAGVFRPGAFEAAPVSEWDLTIDVNVRGVINASHAVLPQMYERDRGHIVNISSAAGLLGVPGMSVYSASKWAVLGLTESIRHEARNRGSHVRVSSIHPMYITTGLFEGAKLSGLGAIVVPQVKDHDVIAKAVVEKALRRGRYLVRRPRTLWLASLLRGILPHRWFLRATRLFGVHTSMNRWRGENRRAARAAEVSRG